MLYNIYKHQGKLSDDQIVDMLNDKFPPGQPIKNEIFGEIDPDRKFSVYLNYAVSMHTRAIFIPSENRININLAYLTGNKKELLSLFGHEGFHASDLNTRTGDSTHFDRDALHQYDASTMEMESRIRDYIGSLSELQARLREVQRMHTDAFGADGIIKSGDVDVGKKFFRWFLFSKNNSDIANEFNGMFPMMLMMTQFVILSCI